MDFKKSTPAENFPIIDAGLGRAQRESMPRLILRSCEKRHSWILRLHKRKSTKQYNNYIFTINNLENICVIELPSWSLVQPQNEVSYAHRTLVNICRILYTVLYLHINHVYIRVDQETLYRAVSCISESKFSKYCPVESHTMYLMGEMLLILNLFPDWPFC